VFCRRHRCPPPCSCLFGSMISSLGPRPVFLRIDPLQSRQGYHPSNVAIMHHAFSPNQSVALWYRGTFALTLMAAFRLRFPSQRYLKQPGYPSFTNCHQLARIAPGLVLSPELQRLGPCGEALLASLADSMLAVPSARASTSAHNWQRSPSYARSRIPSCPHR
jgi:hypothetical protein